MGQTQNIATSQKKGEVCGQTKIAIVARSPFKCEATSTRHPTVHMIAQRHAGIGTNTFILTFLLKVRTKRFGSKTANPAKT